MATSNRAAREQLTEQVRASGLLPPGVDPERAVKAVMCTLTAHLSRGEAMHMLKSLPGDVRTLFEFCATHRGEHGLRFDSEQFFRIVGEHLGISEDRAEDLAKFVFKGIQQWISEEVFQDVESQLPKDLKAVWRAA